MDKPHGIIVFGASGSGCTTLGRELARLLNFEHFDTDDYFFEINNPPFEMKERPLNEGLCEIKLFHRKNGIAYPLCRFSHGLHGFWVCSFAVVKSNAPIKL